MRWDRIGKGVLGGLLGIFLLFGQVEAVPQIIEAQGVHIMGDNDSPKTAKDEARKEAMRDAVEKAGVYVESYSKTKNMQLTDDEIRMVSGAVLKVTDERDVPELKDGVWKYTVYIKAEVDTDGIDLETMMKRKEDIEKLQKERDALKKQNEELLEKYGKAQGKDRRRLGSEYDLNEIFERTTGFLQRGDNDRAIGEMDGIIEDHAVEGAPLSYAYYLRGRAYYGKKDESKALEDFSEALRTRRDTKDEALPVWRAHYYRGLIYYDWRRWQDAEDELQLAWDASDREDDEIGQALERARVKAHPPETRPQRKGVDWEKVITGVIIGAIQNSQRNGWQ